MAKKKAKRPKKKVDVTSHDLYKGIVDIAGIRLRRERLGITQAEAAKRAGWKQQHWALLENAKPDMNPRVRTLYVVAVVLGCKVADLLRE